IAGARGWLNSELERAIAPLERAGKARRLGYVDERELPLIYAGAHAFAFPSLYEGFGLPVLEAMASGVPVLTSNVSSLPEIAGDAALTVDPRDETAVAEGLERLLADSSWRSIASARGIARAREFPWSRCVESTVDAYRAVSGT
ncbi:MAG TPA: glycosyltransferase family 1 protein, partial [Rhodanobacteraceae bacterium]|nr:glycosyltransferase family 1 protein [Rhodanobacteraceae bacterium]